LAVKVLFPNWHVGFFVSHLLYNLLSLKLVVSILLVVAHGGLLLPSLLELASIQKIRYEKLHLLVIHDLISLCLHFSVLDLNETVQVLSVALFLGNLVCDLSIFSMLDLCLQVVQLCVFLQSLLIGEVFDDIGGLLRSEVGLLVQKFFHSSASTRIFVRINLLLDILLVHAVGLNSGLVLFLLQDLLFPDVAKELVALVLPLRLQVTQVVFEPVVGGCASAALTLVGMFALLLHVGVDGVGTL